MLTTLITAIIAASPFPSLLNASEPVDSDAGKRSLGLSVGGLRLFTTNATDPDVIAPVALEGSSRVSEATVLFLRVPIGLGVVRFGAPTTSGAGLVVTTGGQFGVRHAFGTEFVRPFIGAQVTGIYVLSRTPTLFAGPGVVAGLETARFAESLSIQLLGHFDWFVVLNGPQAFSVGATLGVTTAF
jgi:hypothetical protein